MPSNKELDKQLKSLGFDNELLTTIIAKIKDLSILESYEVKKYLEQHIIESNLELFL